jgi:uncharacterized protein DUF1706
MGADYSTHKTGLLESLRREHGALAQTLAPLTPERMTTPGVHGDGNEPWTVKDILSHITWWEQSVFGWLGLPPAVSRSPLPEGELSEDEANHAIFEGNKARALDEVLGSFERSFASLVRAVEEAGEERLSQPRASDPGGTPIYELIPGNTYDHYRAHHDAIRHWIAEQEKR